VLWRPGHKQALRLKGVVRNLLEGSLQDERNRVMSGNVSAALQGLKTLAEHYKESHSAQRFAEAQSYLSELTEHVYQLSESLGNNIRVLFSRINDEFGYVASVEAKIRENQLECFRFDQLSEVAGNHSELRHLLVVTLQQRFAKAAQELSVVQARLLALLGRFREFQGRTRLLKGFMLHLEQQPDFAPRNYASMTNLPALFNQSNPVLAPAAADITNSEHENVLAIIAASVSDKQLRQPQRTVPQKAVALSVDAQEAITLSSSKLQKAVEKLFESVIDSGELTSALEFYEKQQLEFDTEAWLYQVIGEYDALDIRDKEFVALECEGRPDPVFTGNYYIEDIKLGLR
jgi:hypothetical protein